MSPKAGIVLPLFFALATFADAQVDFNFRPIIGVLAQTLDDKDHTSYIAASYVKYIEGSGARVVPIFINQDDAYYERIASSVNGFLFPGGGVSITNSSGYGAAGQFLYDYAVKAFEQGIHVPVWGTCLGFEMITYLGANYHDWLTSCHAENKADKLTLQDGYNDSRIFTQMPDDVVDYVRLLNTTVNFHDWCMTPENFTVSGLSTDFKMLSTSFDHDDLEYVSLIEHNALPIFASQFHPEKNPYEWANDKSHTAIPHDPFSVGVAHFFSNFFVNQARYNTQHFSTQEEEEAALIYNYDTIYSGALGSVFTEVYIFH